MSFSTYLSFEIVALVSASIYGTVAAIREILVLREEILNRHAEKQDIETRMEVWADTLRAELKNLNKNND